MSELEKLRKIRDLAAKYMSCLVTKCSCGELAVQEAGDWSGSSFYCQKCLEAATAPTPTGQFSMRCEVFGPPFKQNDEIMELYNLLRETDK